MDWYNDWYRFKNNVINIMINVSTKNGDSGKTDLASGERLSKAGVRFEVIGDLDELNAWLGACVVKLEADFSEQTEFLQFVQDQLFDLGAEIALAEGVKIDEKLLSAIEQNSQKLQQLMEKDWHTRFLLPGGTEGGSRVDVARTVCRRAERHLVKLSEEEKVRPLLLKILNRLSDYLYVLRCYINHELQYKEKEV